MRVVQLLWVDLRCERVKVSVNAEIKDEYDILCTSNPEFLNENIKTFRPNILCFDYDYPTRIGLQRLRETSNQHPDLPVLMMVNEKSIELAVWALRSRVWNYFIKPVPISLLKANIEYLLSISPGKTSVIQHCWLGEPVSVDNIWPQDKRKQRPSMQAAADYVIENSNSKLTLDHVASLCCMSKSHFSRKFKLEFGVTFQEFVVKQRIGNAVKLLKDSDLSVTEVALEVGFKDGAHFSRTFQKYMGVGPSCFRSSYSSCTSQHKNY